MMLILATICNRRIGIMDERRFFGPGAFVLVDCPPPLLEKVCNVLYSVPVIVLVTIFGFLLQVSEVFIEAHILHGREINGL